MSTFNIFSIFSYDKLVKSISDLKIKHFNTERYWNSPIILDTSYLRYPSFLSFKLLTDFIDINRFVELEKFMLFNSTYRSLNFYQPKSIEDVGFSLKEIEKITRLKEYFTKSVEKDSQHYTDIKNFYKFIVEYEIRRGMKCLDYFPELEKFIKTHGYRV